MKWLYVLALVVAVYAHTPINERSWIKFRKIKDPTYVTVPINEEATIIRAKQIDIVQKISNVAAIIHKSMKDFQEHMRKYTADITKCVKRATQTANEYGFVRRPELRHQYGMLFNHHGQVISSLKNLDFFPVNRLTKS